MDIDSLLAGGLRGCALITRGGETLCHRAFGYADLPNRVPNRIDTRFATASAGKVFVAVGILQLIESGRLRFADSLGELLDLDLKAIDPHITVEELLTHTSGIPDYFDESVMEEYEELWTDFPNYRVRKNSDLLPLFIDKPMMYPRGGRFQYNNTGFVVLALILERVTNLPFDEALKQSVFVPCGMRSTGYYELDRLPARCAANYILDARDGSYRTNIYSVDAKGTGAGGAFTTAQDVRSFWTHLLAGRLLSPDMTEAMLSNHSGEARCYGYGIWLDAKGEACTPYFQGSDPGVSFLSRYDRERDLLITLMSNYADDVWYLMRALRAALE